MEMVTQNPMNSCALFMRLATYWNLITAVEIVVEIVHTRTGKDTTSS